MRFEDKLKNRSSMAIWQEYCGFLDLGIDDYMDIQNSLMKEQLQIWSDCSLGKEILKGKKINSIEEFRDNFPITEYADYADILLQKRSDMLPGEPTIWIQTTWEGGKHPVKLAPYTQGMLNTYKNNILACMLLGTSHGKGKFDVKANDTFLYGLAPLPYATGLFPRALADEIDIKFLPPVSEAEQMTFGERNKKGFKMGLSKGIDYFFGLGSVAYFVSMSLSKMSGGGKSGAKTACSPKFAFRYIKAKRACEKEGRELKPKDLFKLKGIMVAGTDNNCYKDELEDLWGIRPMELFAGTEPSCIGTETWTRDGMYFFPDTCFYEFIPETEMMKSREFKNYHPKTCLMNEVIPGEKYELVISVLKGGAFMRYRVGDVYRCVGLENSEDQTKIPRFHYIDRSPEIIDIAGFTRISQKAIENVIKISGLDVADWVAMKEYTENNKPKMHMYVEMKPECLATSAVSSEILKEHLTVYFKYIDQDYKDLKRILGMDPLEVTVLKCGTFESYREKSGKRLRKMNPSVYDLREVLACG